MRSLSLSVAMCTYNGSRYLGEQLRSIAAQDHLPSEMIICDDGSADDTVRLLTEFASQAPFPVHVEANKERLGLAKNFEKAIGRCQGEIIALADQDDIWKPPKLEGLAAALEEHPSASYAFSDAEMVDERGASRGDSLWGAMGFQGKLKEFSGEGQLRILLKHEVVTGAAMAFRVSLRELILPIPSEWLHDHWIALLGSALFEGIPVPERLLMYRRHPAQLIGVKGDAISQVWGASLATTGKDSWRKAQRFQELVERVASVSSIADCPAGNMRLLEEKLVHLRERASIRSTVGIKRVARVGREALTGRYQRYSRSWRSVVRDLWPNLPVRREPR